MATQRVVIQIQQRGGAQTERAIRRVGVAARATQQAVNGFRNVLVGLAAVSAAKGLVDFVDTVTRVDNRLRLLTDSQSQANRSFAALLDTANRTRTDLESTVELYARLSRSTEQLGFTQQELLDLTAGVSQAFQVFGATSQEASAAVIQFSQGLAAGALRGDELRSVLEQGPRLAAALVDGLNEIEAFGPATNVALGDLRELGKQGELTADLVTRALQTQLGVLQEEFDQTVPTISQAFVRLQNTFLATVREVDSATGFIDILINAILSLEGFIVQAGRAAVNFGTGLTVLGEAASAIADSFLAGAEQIGAFLDALSGGELSALVATIGGLIAAFTTLDEKGAQTNALFQELTFTIGGLGLALFALAGPIGAVVGLAAGAAIAFGNLRNSATAATEAAREISQQLQVQFDDVDSLTGALQNNTIVTVQQARSSLAEATARRENILALRDEATARRNALREEIEGILIRARALQEDQSDIPLIGALLNLDENIQLIQLEGQLKNAFEAYQALDAQVQSFDDTLAQSQVNIQGVNDLLERDNVLLDQSTDARKAREAAVEAENDAVKEAERLAERQEATFKRLAVSVGLVAIESGRGSDALEELRRILDRVSEAEALGNITTERAIELRRELNTLITQAQAQTAQDVLDNLRAENELLSQTAEQQALVNQLRQEGLQVSDLTNAQLEEFLGLLREREFQEVAQELQQELSGGLEEVAMRLEAANALLEQGAITGRQYAQVAREAAIAQREFSLAATGGSFADGFIVELDRIAGRLNSFQAETGSILASTFDQLGRGFADTIGAAIFDVDNLGESLKALAREAISGLVSSLIQLGIQFAIQRVLAEALGVSVAQTDKSFNSLASNVALAAAEQAALFAISAGFTAATVALQRQAGASIASAFAPAAALVSAATAGANAIPAGIGLTALSSQAAAIASTAAFRDGTDFVEGPGTGTSDSVLARLSRGEGVVTARANAANPGMVAAMNRGERVGRNVTVNFNLGPGSDVESFRKSRTQIIRETQQAMDAV